MFKVFQLVLLYILIIVPLFAIPVQSDLHIFKKETHPNEKIFLLLGGIQGDEPGGFNAASIVASKHYTIKKGNVWIVPNLNQHSILENHRGIYGDMNRKFATIKDNDPEKELIMSIKKLIRHEQVEVILHLHDGSGFYHETYISKLRNPTRWGQSSIIDQERLENVPHGELNAIMKQITGEINQHLLDDSHRYRIRNTNTATSDKEQQRSLTFYAINQGKAAFANEASKNLPLKQRVYYHLLAIEAMMNYLGIEFERDFPLTPQGVDDTINDKDIVIHFANRITLPINRLKRTVNFFPIPLSRQLEYDSPCPLVHLYRKNGNFIIKYGNRVSAALIPDTFETDMSNELTKVSMSIDGAVQEVELGSIVKAKKIFMVQPIHNVNIRVNIIGFSQKGLVSEEGVSISNKKINSRYTLDSKGTLVRVEFYNKNRFSGMIIVDFEQ